jgi:threonine synthase
MGPLGFWKGFQELYEMGLVDHMPKLAMIQAAGCAPMVRAFRKDLPEAEVVSTPNTRVITIATGAPGPAYSHLYKIVKTTAAPSSPSPTKRPSGHCTFWQKWKVSR